MRSNGNGSVWNILVAAVAMVFLATGSSLADITLFGDTFDRPDSTDLNASTAGKSGTLGALTWVQLGSGGGMEILSNQLKGGDNGAGGGWGVSYPDHNFTDAVISSGGEFTVAFDLGPVISGGGTRFTGFAVGHSKAEMDGWSANNPALFASDFFFGYDPTGTKEVKVFINGGTQDYQQGINLDAGALLSVRFSNITDFNSSSSVSYEAFINGGSVKTGSFTWSGTNENYLGLYSNYTVRGGLMDNFTVTAIPEPATLSLAVLTGLALLMRRRMR